MTEQAKLTWLYILSGAFILINTLFIAYEYYWFNILPGIAVIILLALFSLDKLMYIIVFLTPLSITLKDVKEFGVALSVPTEPLLFGVTIIFLFRYLYEGYIDKKVIRHPITILIILNLAWMFLTTLTSEMPLVSLKYFISRLWFVIPFYFVGILLFKNKENIARYIWTYLLSFTIVVIYTLINHARGNFAEQPAHVAMVPFYNDHTSYGAMLAMFIPLMFVFMTWKSFTRTQRLFTVILFLILLFATVMSYTRAAWVSLGVALSVYVILKLRIKFVTVLTIGVAGMVTFFAFQERIFMKLEKNKKASSSDLTEHIQSISNISTDASNLERINRWQSAIRMFKEKPVFGWGPGTYMFQYAPYQFSYEKTYISTNAGDRGNAHSEYIGPLAESGIPGMLSVIALVIAVLYTGVSLYKRTEGDPKRYLLLATLLGLITYFVHGILNNFLDTDKASAPFWGFIAILVAYDIYHSNRSKKPAGE